MCVCVCVVRMIKILPSQKYTHIYIYIYTHYFFSHNFCQNGWIFIDTGDVKTSQCGGRGEINQQGDFGEAQVITVDLQSRRKLQYREADYFEAAAAATPRQASFIVLASTV